ncbi:hypothetical protein AB0K47_22420 [Streptomyces tirandamycinicus]|uniref:hypothetical protein n=1 Tax=Streptomyces tirandamycinicus TaxID=2174846 RepID=UPI00343B0E33
MAEKSKPGSKPYRRDLRERLKSLGFADHQIDDVVTAELVQMCHIRPRTARRLARELTLDEVATRYSSLRNDAESRMRGSRIWDYEQWPNRGVRPTVHTLRTLAEVYGTTWVELVDIEDLQHMPEEDRELYHLRVSGGPSDTRAAPTTPPTAPLPASAPPPAHAPAPAPDRPRPRPAPAQPDPSGPAGTAELIRTGAEHALGVARSLSTTNVDNLTLHQLEQELVGTSRSYVHSSPYPLYFRLAQLGNHIAQLLPGRQRPSQTRRLNALAARCSALLAWVCDDLGAAAAAHDHAWAAWIYASHSESENAQRCVSLVRSRLAFSSGDFVESARIADSACSGVPQDSVGSHLLLRRALAWARAGQHHKVHEALRDWKARGEEGPLGAGDGIFELQQAQQRYFVGAALLDILDVEHGLDELRTAIDLFNRTPEDLRSYVEHSLSHIGTAKAFVVLGDVQEASKVVEPVFDLAPERRVRAILSSLRELVAFTAGRPTYGSQLARELSERIDEFASHAITRRLHSVV